MDCGEVEEVKFQKGRSPWNKGKPHPGPMNYPAETVALVRAACYARMGHKLIAKGSGISISVIEKISQGERWPEIEPHPEFTKRLHSLFNPDLSDAKAKESEIS